MLNAVRVLPFSVLKRGQRLGIFLIFLFAAVATPSTDPFTMIAMAVPMVLLFELAVLWCFLYDRRRARRSWPRRSSSCPTTWPRRWTRSRSGSTRRTDRPPSAARLARTLP